MIEILKIIITEDPMDRLQGYWMIFIHEAYDVLALKMPISRKSSKLRLFRSVLGQMKVRILFSVQFCIKFDL